MAGSWDILFTWEVMDGDEFGSSELVKCLGAFRRAGQVAEVGASVLQGQHVEVEFFPVHSHQDVAVLACLSHSLQPSGEVVFPGHGIHLQYTSTPNLVDQKPPLSTWNLHPNQLLLINF